MRNITKVICLLLCICFLPHALADQAVSLKVEVSQEGLSEYLALCHVPEFMAEMYSAFVKGLVEAADIRLGAGKKALSISVQSGSMQSSVRLFDAEGQKYLTLSQIPGTAFRIPARDSLMEPVSALWQSVSEKLDAAVPEKGRFWGMAYTGGDSRQSVTFSQKELANLLKDVLESETVSSLAGNLGISLHDLISEEERAAEEERYSLTVSRVSGGNGALGYSFTFSDGENPVILLSLGLSEGEWHAVLGLGLASFASYTDLRVHREVLEDGVVQLLCGLDLTLDSGFLGYEAVRGFEEPEGSCVFSVRYHPEGKLDPFACELYLEQNGQVILMQKAGVSEGLFQADSRRAEDEEPFLSVSGSVEESEDLSFDPEGLTVLPLTELPGLAGGDLGTVFRMLLDLFRNRN